MKATIFPLFFLLLITASFTPPKGFKAEQIQFSRVKTAYQHKEKWADSLLKAHKLAKNNLHIRLVAYKHESTLQVWGKSPEQANYSLLKTYSVCAASGTPGPKSKMGDYQVPEGVYHIDRFNPASNFLLSLGLNYPNAADRKRAGSNNPGGDIFIHGNCVSIGCLAMTDALIEEIYLLAVEARNKGQQQIPVYIFPCHMSGPHYTGLQKKYPAQAAFWKQLQPVYEKVVAGQPVNVSINKAGAYSIT